MFRNIWWREEFNHLTEKLTKQFTFVSIKSKDHNAFGPTEHQSSFCIVAHSP